MVAIDLSNRRIVNLGKNDLIVPVDKYMDELDIPRFVNRPMLPDPVHYVHGSNVKIDEFNRGTFLTSSLDLGIMWATNSGAEGVYFAGRHLPIGKENRTLHLVKIDPKKYRHVDKETNFVIDGFDLGSKGLSHANCQKWADANPQENGVVIHQVSDLGIADVVWVVKPKSAHIVERFNVYSVVFKNKKHWKGWSNRLLNARLVQLTKSGFWRMVDDTQS